MQLPEAAAAQTRWWLAASGGHTLCFLKIDYLFIVYIYAHHGGQRTAHRSKRMSPPLEAGSQESVQGMKLRLTGTAERTFITKPSC